MWGQRRMLAAVAAAAFLGATAPAARADGWIASWGASDVFPIGQQINYQTLRQIVRLSAGGKQVTAAAAIPSPKTSTSRFFLNEVDVNASGQPAVVVALGDSI